MLDIYHTITNKLQTQIYRFNVASFSFFPLSTLWAVRITAYSGEERLLRITTISVRVK